MRSRMWRVASATSAPNHVARLIGLGVPLNTEHETPTGHLDRLGQPVHRRATADPKALAQPVYALVMVGLGGVTGLSRGARRKRALDQIDVVVGAVEGAGDAQVFVVAEALGEMLQQGAAIGDVDELHTTTDPKHRKVALDRRTHERDLEVIALRDRVESLGMGLLAVAGGVDVGAAGQHQAVKQVEYLVGVLEQKLVGGSITTRAPAC